MSNHKKKQSKADRNKKNDLKKAIKDYYKINKVLNEELKASRKKEKKLKSIIAKLEKQFEAWKKKQTKKNKASKGKSQKVKKSSNHNSKNKKAKDSKSGNNTKSPLKSKAEKKDKASRKPPARPQPKKVVSAPKSKSRSLDNFKRIEGIGPAIERHLKSAKIDSFEKLSKTTPKKIKEILLEKGGTRYNVHDPVNWPKQAKLAAAGKFEELKKLQNNLKGGK